MEHFASVGPSVTWEVLVLLEEKSTYLRPLHRPVAAQDGHGASPAKAGHLGTLEPFPNRH